MFCKQAKLQFAQAALDRARQLVSSRSIPSEEFEQAARTHGVHDAQVVRIPEEARYLEALRKEAIVVAPAAGLITTPHLRDKVGQFFKEGDLICLIEEPGSLEAEIALSEHEHAAIQPGQRVELKLRAFPFETFPGEVGRMAPGVDSTAMNVGLAPSANLAVPKSTPGDSPGNLILSCRLEDPQSRTAAGDDRVRPDHLQPSRDRRNPRRASVATTANGVLVVNRWRVCSRRSKRTSATWARNCSLA